MIESDFFTTKQAAFMVGDTIRNIHYRRTVPGLVVPEIRNPKTQRTPVLFSRKNIYQFALLKALSELGVPLGHVKQALKVPECWNDPTDQTELLVLTYLDKKWTRCYFDELVKILDNAISSPNGRILTINLTSVKQNVKELVE